MKKYVLLLVIALAFLTNCKKSSTANNNNCTLTSSSLTGKWAFTGATYKRTPASAEIDIYHDPAWFNPCSTDDYTLFNPNGTYAYTDAGTACTPNKSVSGAWRLSNDTIYTSSTVSAYPSHVTSFACTKMVITYNGYDTTGDVAVITYTKIN